MSVWVPAWYPDAWAIYVCMAQGACTPNKLLVNDEMEDWVHSSVNSGIPGKCPPADQKPDWTDRGD